MNPNDRAVDSYGRCRINDNRCHTSRPWDAYNTPSTAATAESTSTTNADRRLLAEVSRWRKANGWTLSGQRGWVNARCSADATLAVDYDEHRDGFTVARKDDRIGTWPLYPDFYPADNVRQTVDMLVALDILPAKFARAFRCGWLRGWSEAAVDNMTASVR